MGNTMGGVSPLDVAAIVEGLMTKEQLPLERVKKSEKSQEIQISVFGQLQSYLNTLQTSLQSVSAAFSAVNYQVTSSNPAAVTAQITSNNVAPIIHTINVTQLAQANSYLSQDFTANDSALNITDSLSFTIGSSILNVSVAATDTLMNVRDNINSATGNPGVSASIMATTSGGVPQYQLVVSSNNTGVANAVAISDGSNSFGFTTNTTALDAEFTFDGNTVDRSTNNVTDVIDGLSFNLLNLGSSTLNISQMDTTSLDANIVTAVQGALNSYNQVLSFIDQTQLNRFTKNDTLPLIKLSLQNAMNTVVPGSGPQSLGDIGIILEAPQEQTTTIQVYDKDGKVVDKQIHYTQTGQLILSNNDSSSVLSSILTSLSTSLSNNFSDVQSLLLDSQNGIFTQLSQILDPDIGSVTNIIQENVDDIDSQKSLYTQRINEEESRLQDLELALYKKYASLNVLLQKLQETNEYLTKQLDHLNHWDKY